LARQLQRNFPPDAAAGARNDGRFTFQMHDSSPLIDGSTPQVYRMVVAEIRIPLKPPIDADHAGAERRSPQDRRRWTPM
jgi:hypothetical protein